MTLEHASKVETEMVAQQGAANQEHSPGASAVMTGVRVAINLAAYRSAVFFAVREFGHYNEIARVAIFTLLASLPAALFASESAGLNSQRRDSSDGPPVARPPR